MNWHELYITDKTGGKFFKTSASPLSTNSEIRNLKHHLEQSKRYPTLYNFLDKESAVIMLDGELYKG